MADEKSGTTVKVLSGLLIVALLVIVVLVIVLVVELKKDDDDESMARVVTRNEVYVREAGRMLRSMNVSVDPCADFWEFACGGFIADNADLPDTLSRYSVYPNDLNEELTNTLQELISTSIDSTDIDSIQKAKTFYQACTDEDTLMTLGGQPMLDLLSELGTWPVLNPNWNEASVDITNLMTSLATKYILNLAQPVVSNDIRNSSFNTLSVGQVNIQMRDYLLDSSASSVDIVNAYHELGVNIAKLLGGNNAADAARIESEMADMFAFETALANITLSGAEMSDSASTYNPMLLSELQQNYSQLWDWEVYLPAVMQTADVTLTPSSRLVVTTPEYFQKLDPLVRSVSKKTLVNYLLWNAVYTFYGQLSSDYTALAAPLTELTTGTTAVEARWKTCISLTNQLMGMVLGRMYSQVKFTAQAKQDTLSMTSDLKSSFMSIMETASWMDDVTRSLALEKLRAMGVGVGYPDYIMDDTLLNAQYAAVTVTPTTHFANTFSVLAAIYLRDLAGYSQPFDDSRWPLGLSPSTVNAAFVSTENRIIFPSAILQKHLYSSTYPRFLNYAGIGTIIGHEITHGFDSSGRLFDLNGNLLDWWTAETSAEYNEKAQCLVTQYGAYSFPDVGNVDGTLTLGENIADNGGLKEAYKAYRNWVSTQGMEEASLPGFEHMSNDQMFFLSHGQVWCEVIRPSQLAYNLRYDNHCPNKYRLIGSLQNSAEFSAAYSCPSGSYMNPSNKCEVW